MSEQNNRWWENYVPRYLAGIIFAVLILFYLVMFHGDSIQQRLCSGIWIQTELQIKQCLNNYEFQNSCLSNNVLKINYCKKSFSEKNCDNSDKVSKNIALCEKDKFSSQVFNFIFVTTKDINLLDKKLYSMESEIISNKNSQINITEINFPNIFVIGVLSFLYMYISSLPIYFFHITRGAFVEIIKNHGEDIITITTICFILWAYIFYLFNKNIEITYKNYILFIFYLTIFLSIYLMRGHIFLFLRKSTKIRYKIQSHGKEDSPKILINLYPFKNQQPKNNNQDFSPEYITSYQHCREHGNTAGIILMEILFSFLLIQFNFSLWFIISWLMLGFSGWFIGIYLEYKMIEE